MREGLLEGLGVPFMVSFPNQIKHKTVCVIIWTDRWDKGNIFSDSASQNQDRERFALSYPWSRGNHLQA
jgi:hypothetical protein